MMSGLQPLLQRRLARHLQRWPSAVVDEIVAYLGVCPGRPETRHDGAERFWSLLPRWLLSDRRFRPASGTPRAFLDDVLWGQYCLFLFVRIHDDFLDGQARSSSLVFVADWLLVESQAAFAKQVGDPEFWRLFRRNLGATLQAILQVDDLQRRAGAMNAAMLSLHSEVSAIFKIGSAAVCVRSGRMHEFRLIARCADHVAIAEQILDDTLDIEEDLARGRYSFAYNDLCGHARSNPGGAEGLARSVLLGGGVRALMERAQRHLRQADAAVSTLNVAPLSTYLNSFQRHIDELRQTFHEARASRVLGDLLPAKRRPPPR